MDQLNTLTYKLLWGQLWELGQFTQHPFDLDALKAKVHSRYGSWLKESLTQLSEQGYIRLPQGQGLAKAAPPVHLNEVWEEWAAAKKEWLRNPNLHAQVNLLETALRALPAILTGRIAATDVLFPNGSMELVEGIYKHNPVSDYFNEVLANTAAAYVKSLGQGQRIRILELGAGTGGTSEMVFRKLEPYREQIAEYVYSDLSKAFLIHAQEQYGPAVPYLSCRIVNVEEPLAEQGISPGTFDMVIASNVLHATKNIRLTLRTVKSALKKNGLLLLNEMSHNTLFAHLTFGLLDGWWLYEDDWLRIPGSPALTSETWTKVLEQEGFQSVYFPAQEARSLGQQIIACQSDGVVRQSDTTSAKRTSSNMDTAAAMIISTTADDIGKVEPKADWTPQDNDRYVQAVKLMLRKHISTALKVDRDQIAPNHAFADYGLDSITGVHLIQLVNEELGLELPTTDLFTYSSINQFTGYLLAEHGEAVSRVFGAADRIAPQANARPNSAGESLREADCGTNEVKSPLAFQKADGRARGPAHKEPIAIIGMSGRFAKSRNIEELWEHLASGTDLVGEITRWKQSDSTIVRYGSLLDDYDQFDPYFFHISGTEAVYMDPQQRLFLEESWKALEDAGYAGSAIEGRRCGVYVGYNIGDYMHLIGDNPPAQAMWGNAGSIVAARISYYLNLKGPAIAVDTACSSSLVSVHLACQGLWARETDMSLAGGVFIQSTPAFHDSAQRAGMLSASGRCYTFDERADGFVPGEGVGAVVLKRLSDAITAGDHIYGVIAGSGMNQDGTTNGITAPSGTAQEELEREVYEQFGIDPGRIQLVEAHGTGTKLGDPIEHEALTRAFRHYTAKTEYCAIGSIKTTIGHTIAAAGIAGLIKLMLSLKYKKLPPSLHYQKGNANIRMEGSPFYVNTRLKEWPAEPGESRFAAISSFGFSGTNVHMVLQEAPTIDRQPRPTRSHLLVLSAQSDAQLRQQAEQLIAYCGKHPEADIGDMSYTLLIGRKHLPHRLVCIIEDVTALVAVLNRWLLEGSAPGLFASVVHEWERQEDAIKKNEGLACIMEWRNSEFDKPEMLERIARLYQQGYELAYDKLFTASQYRRISLPVYPFARERFWVPLSGVSESVKEDGRQQSEVLHPLVHRNTSTLTEQRYSSVFTGDEPFFADHVLNGQQIFPGSAYLEMAHAAVRLATESAADDGRILQLKHVGWVQPLIARDEPVVLHIALASGENEEITFEVYSLSGDKDREEAVVHFQGSGRWTAAATEERLNVREAQAACRHTVSSEACYEAFAQIGFQYGITHKGIEQLHIGEQAALAKLSMLADRGSVEPFTMHPGLLDAALQSMAGLVVGENNVSPLDGSLRLSPLLPFAIETVDIVHAMDAEMWAYLRFSHDSGRHGGIKKIDIDLVDAQGRLCVRIKGYAARPVQASAHSDEGVLLFEPIWETAEKSIDSNEAVHRYERRIVVAAEDCTFALKEIEGQEGDVRCIALQTEHQDKIDLRYHAYAEQLLGIVQEVLQDKRSTIIQLLIGHADQQQLAAGLSGMLKTAAMEEPRIAGQLIELEAQSSEHDLAQLLAAYAKQPELQHIRLNREQHSILRWREMCTVPEPSAVVPWKDGGVYLITGGTGGLGVLFAEEIARRTRGAVLILAGRSALDQNKRERIEQLTNRGLTVEYRQTDVGSLEAIETLVQEICRKYGTLNGIVHGAGVIQDAYLKKKSADELQQVLRPKVSGTVHLDEATRHIPLDFFLLFSALAGVIGNPAQADYAAANAFLNRFAAYRNELAGAGQRHGRTVSICWPLWQEGGMQVHAETAKLLKQKSGMRAMASSTGIQAFYMALAAGKSQITVIDGEKETLRAFMRMAQNEGKAQAFESGKKEPSAWDQSDALQEKAVAYLTNLISSVAGTPASRMDPDTPMETYGLDSVMVMQITSRLEAAFGSLSKTLFFEYPNIGRLAAFFIEHHRFRLAELVGAKMSAEDSMSPITVLPKPKEAGRKAARPMSKPKRLTEARDGSRVHDIAIIGIAGRYPGAKNIEQFWEKLRDGQDCISEIPPDRWDHSVYYDPDKNKPGKVYTKWGGFVEGVDRFDPLFFHISPREAEIMDPQERLFLQCVYEAIEDAGYTRETLVAEGQGKTKRVGVFVGVMNEEYQLYGAELTARGKPIALSGNPSSVANRVSYFCDFKGPSMAVDTMCSSSLTAIHLACQSLRQGESRVAVAGGVNVSVHPNKYIFLSQGKFASSKGRCESFGKDGDGYVPGEGVGAALLKPLEDAIADGDHIYGIIKGTAINHGGKTNGYSVPSPVAQADVIGEAIKDAGIDPRTISYIEAHGTGTSLGDPIEIAGLSQSFRAYTADVRFCAIGSAKSNIGHCESAAGIAGLTKVLLQMKYGQLAPSLHAEELNPNIDFEQSPFVVQRTLEDWNRPVLTIDGTTRKLPRIAGLSSFGAGGSNGHLVIEEYISEEHVTGEKQTYHRHDPAIIVLSARDEDRLHHVAQRLLSFIRDQGCDHINLENLAYTLQVGREAMEERLAMLVGSIEELENKLLAYLADREESNNVFRGHIQTNELMQMWRTDEDLSETFKAWMRKGKFGKILGLWVKGLNIDWRLLYEDTVPHRMSLPTYPFAEERYWIPETDSIFAREGHGGKPLHPLLHRNTSDVSELRFSSLFTGKEHFLSDHVVDGNKVMPGAAYLEMIRAAAEAAAGKLLSSKGTRLHQIVWRKPLVMNNASSEVHIRLRKEDEELACEVFSDQGEDEIETLYCTATVSLQEPEESPIMDIDVIRAQCSGPKLSGEQCYRAFESAGLLYGPGNRGIRSIYTGNAQALANVFVPAEAASTSHDYVLHPSLIDSVFQATIGLFPRQVLEAMEGQPQSESPIVPFALEELDILGPCSGEMWAWIRFSSGLLPESPVRKLDIELIDSSGIVCVRMRGLTSRRIDREEVRDQPVEPLKETLLFQPIWELKPCHTGKNTVTYTRRIVLLGGSDNSLADQLMQQGGGAEVHLLGDGLESMTLASRYTFYAKRMLKQLQSALHGTEGRTLIQLVLPYNDNQRVMVGLSGMLKTAALEHPGVVGQTILLGTDSEGSAIAGIIDENGSEPEDAVIRYEAGNRYVQKVVEMGLKNGVPVPWKDNGTYLITGGCGKLGMIAARDAAARTRGANLILTGRSAYDERIQKHLDELKAVGAHAEYYSLDISDASAIQELIERIEARYGGLSGIIHCAGTRADSLILKKTEMDIDRVFAAKVAGLIHLDRSTRHMELDFMLLYSSLAGTLGNFGQADYAAANGFMDAFAAHRNDLTASGLRKGKACSIAWPLWEEGGMQIDEETLSMMNRLTGMSVLETAGGLHALYAATASASDHVLTIAGDPSRMRAALTAGNQSPPQAQARTAAVVQQPVKVDGIPAFPQDELEKKTIAYLKSLVSAVIKLPVERMHEDTPFEKYGVDSVTIMQLTASLEQSFGTLSKSLFFEYMTIRELAGYLMRAHLGRLPAVLGLEDGSSFGSVASIPERAGLSRHDSHAVEKAEPSTGTNDVETAGATTEWRPEDIAIIGVAGRYPGARDVEAFWHNIRNGVDSITEIPADRWNHEAIFDAEPDKQGKTYSKWGGFLEGVDRFDPLFFHISRKEAAFMDPQERLFLQCTYELLQDAGYTRHGLQQLDSSGLGGNVGVYVGVMYEEYQLYGAEETVRGRPVALSGSASSIANRVSYFYNLHGPSLAIDTMCSSSLTAIHLACQSLREGECDAAIAGGVNLSIHPNKYLALAQGKFASSKGRCESFGEGGDGYVPGEGVGAVLLKPLSRAIADKDRIYGVIKGSAVNHGGKTNGYSVPNPKAQASVIERAIRKSGIDPGAISYIEAHGTGTSLGDPIEIKGLSDAWKTSALPTSVCAIGSVKSNIGHCESAAGIAGLTKVLMQLKYGELAPSLHSEKLNPNIVFPDTPFRVQQKLEEWKRPVVEAGGEKQAMPRIAGISSFGAGGSNAHLIVEEYKPPAAAHSIDQAGRTVPIVLSAPNKEGLKRLASRYLDAIAMRQITDDNLSDAAYTLQVGREAMEERAAMAVSSVLELKRGLQAIVENGRMEKLHLGRAKSGAALSELQAGAPDESTWLGWFASGKFEPLLSVWVSGIDFDWRLVYGKTTPRRISLPSYPFAEEKCWYNISGNGHQSAGTNGSEPAPAPKVHIHEAGTMDREAVETITLRPLSNIPDQIDHGSGHSLRLPPIKLKKIDGVSKQRISLDVLTEQLAESLADTMFMERAELDPERKFVEIGVDSIIGVEWIKAVNKKYDVSITATKIYDYSTLSEFAAYLHGVIAEKPALVGNEAEAEAEHDYDHVSQLPKQTAALTAAEHVDPAEERTPPPNSGVSLEALEEQLVQSMAEAMFMQPDEIDPEIKFVDIGVDSIVGVEWIKAVNKQYGTSITATKIYDYSTIRQFAAYLSSELSRGQGATPEQEAVRSPLLLDDILQQVESGRLDIHEANDYVSRLILEEERN
ncbi:SDR family NAD(P)-dependent oxidoreductase [Brevibacillus brevis]|uniref:SDR family NAD(P)-dependent oxidoreductase n=1 Tax=Brevibacillus brevis TaxID=1393 RepID=A0A2Z4MPM9_BREBE|nr:SDR family NAD(P)-dependent oxidoreductase [Brevibacillus brevis]AWX58468.1 SDR family NAD(P)-dependent oxidoreductase [Brevibacillus brevis]